jgi:di/tricarboxylate transporter
MIPLVRFLTLMGAFALLFHMIPAITDGLMRLPLVNPVLDSIESPLLKGFYAAFLLTYLVGVSLQIRRIAKPAG